VVGRVGEREVVFRGGMAMDDSVLVVSRCFFYSLTALVNGELDEMGL